MKLNTTDFRRKCQHPLLLALAIFPVMLLLAINAAPECLAAMGGYLGAWVLLAWGCILIPGKKRLMAGLVSGALLAGLAAVMLPLREKPVLLLLPLVYIPLLLAVLPMGGWERSRELPLAMHVAGVLTHVLLQLIISAAEMVGNAAYLPAKTPLLLSFLAYAVLVLLALNRSSLDSAAQSRRRVPLIMRRQNLVLTLALLGIGVLIAAIPAIGSVLGMAWDWLMRGVAFVAALIAALMPQRSSGGGGGGGAPEADMGLGEAYEPSQLALLMEKIIGWAALIVMVIGLFFLLRAAGKKLYQLLKTLWRHLGRYGAAAGEDYEDEITDTRDESDVEREGLLGRLRRMVPAEEKGLTPAQQVRSRYRRLKQRRKWHDASTARENLPEDASRLYEQARYSGQPLTQADAERFQEGTKRV